MRNSSGFAKITDICTFIAILDKHISTTFKNIFMCGFIRTIAHLLLTTISYCACLQCNLRAYYIILPSNVNSVPQINLLVLDPIGNNNDTILHRNATHNSKNNIVSTR